MAVAAYVAFSWGRQASESIKIGGLSWVVQWAFILFPALLLWIFWKKFITPYLKDDKFKLEDDGKPDDRIEW